MKIGQSGFSLIWPTIKSDPFLYTVHCMPFDTGIEPHLSRLIVNTFHRIQEEVPLK